jgi:hypothetical protein
MDLGVAEMGVTPGVGPHFGRRQLGSRVGDSERRTVARQEIHRALGRRRAGQRQRAGPQAQEARRPGGPVDRDLGAARAILDQAQHRGRRGFGREDRDRGEGQGQGGEGGQERFHRQLPGKARAPGAGSLRIYNQVVNPTAAPGT